MSNKAITSHLSAESDLELETKFFEEHWGKSQVQNLV